MSLNSMLLITDKYRTHYNITNDSLNIESHCIPWQVGPTDAETINKTNVFIVHISPKSPRFTKPCLSKAQHHWQ